MVEGGAPPFARGTLRATITGVGRPGPIEVRLGRRLVRIVDPASKEGVNLLRERRVTFIGPEGTPMGQLDLVEARHLLRIRLESILAGAHRGDDTEAIRDGLQRLGRSSPRTGRA